VVQGEGRETGFGRIVTVATGAAVISIIPVYLLGALAVFVRVDLEFDRQRLGYLLAAFFIVSAATSVPGGRLAERLRPRRALITSVSVSSVSLAGMGLLSQSWLHMLGWLTLAGCANGLAHPAASLLLAEGTRTRQGLAFGFKQSAVPLSTMVAGVMIPGIGLTLGWRAAFLLVAVTAALFTCVIPADRATRTEGRRGTHAGRLGDTPAWPLIALSAAAGIAVAAGVALGTFFMDYALVIGISPATGGLLLAASSVVAAATRIWLGWRADRRNGGNLNTVAALLALGCVGYLLLAVASVPAVFVLGATIAYAAGWGWNGLLILSVARLNRNAPAAATGIVQVGLTGGAAVGPIAFTTVLSSTSFGVAWTVASVAVLMSAGGVLVARSWIRRGRH
jgi:predicted MFS family arabinose efflux permease